MEDAGALDVLADLLHGGARLTPDQYSSPRTPVKLARLLSRWDSGVTRDHVEARPLRHLLRAVN